jgi:hypothetical protein
MSTLKQTKHEKDKEKLISICHGFGIRLEVATEIANIFLEKPKKTDEEQLLFDFGDDLDSN